MTMNDLPPGPWQLVQDANWYDYNVTDARGMNLFRILDRTSVQPQVLRAIETLPLLVEAARKAVGAIGDLDLFPELAQLRTALEQIETAQSGAREAK